MNDESKTPTRQGQGMDYGEQSDVQQVHAAVQREKREPRVGAEPLSIWLIAIYELAIFFGGAYLGRYSGNFTSGGLDPMGAPPPPKKAVAGGPGGAEQAAELSPHVAIGEAAGEPWAYVAISRKIEHEVWSPSTGTTSPSSRRANASAGASGPR